jgi:hypothetical protein
MMSTPMNTQDDGNGPFVSDASDHPCETCGDDVAIAYLGVRQGYALVRCFNGHPRGWAPWPDFGPEGPRKFDS